MHGDPVASAVWHPGGAVMATCSGQRKFNDADEDEATTEPDSSLKIWSEWSSLASRFSETRRIALCFALDTHESSTLALEMMQIIMKISTQDASI
jgi:hypothetical protein